jgi:putative addiction module component (TIGR02574 family)
MSALPPDLARLTTVEKMALIDLLWQSIPESEIPIPEYHRRLIAERIAEFEADPDEGQDWEEVKAELEQDP